MALSDLLAGDKFIQGYDSSRQRGMQDQALQMQQAQSLMALLQHAQAQQEKQKAIQRDEVLRNVVSQAGSVEAAIPLLVKQGPEGIKLAGVLAEATKDLRNPQSKLINVPPDGALYDPQTKQEVYKAGSKPKEPKTRTFQEGDQSVTQELDADGTWKEIGRGPKFAKSVGPTIVNPAPVTSIVVKDETSPTGWSYKDARTGRVTSQGAPPPTQSSEAAGIAGQKVTAREMAERDLAYPEATKQTNIAAENLDHLSKELRSLKDHPGLPGITGAVYGRTPSVAKNSMAAHRIYENIVNNIFVNALQSMRNASKTGGAVGNVSDREGDKLEQTLAALGRAQSTEDFRKQIKTALDRLEIAKKNIREAYESTYEYKKGKSDGTWKVVR